MKTLITTFLFMMGLFFAYEHNQNNADNKTHIDKTPNQLAPSGKASINNSNKNAIDNNRLITKPPAKPIFFIVTDSIPLRDVPSFQAQENKKHQKTHTTTMLLEPVLFSNSSRNIIIAPKKPELPPNS